MNNQDSSPSPTQKLITQQKQTNSIRRITTQSLAPIITKLEEHITYLLEQTTNLRAQNNHLIITSANQKTLQDQIIKINHSLSALSLKIEDVSSDKDIKIRERQKQNQKLAEEMQLLQKESQTLSNRVDEINSSNEDYINRIDTNKTEQLQSIEQLKSNIENYYEQELIKIQSFNEEFQTLKTQLSVYNQSRHSDQQELKRIGQIITLYQCQREQIKKIIDKTSFLQNNAVMVTDYQKDKKYHRIQIDTAKKEIKEMIDEALTPDIRKFLPILINKLGQLQQFQSKLLRITTQLDSLQQSHKKRIDQLEEVTMTQIKQLSEQSQSKFADLSALLNKNVSQLEQKLLNNDQKYFYKTKDIEQQLIQMGKKWQQNLAKSIEKQTIQHQEYLNVWGDKFLDKKKDNIFQLVQSQKPAEQKQEQTRVFQVVNEMEPLLRQVREELKLTLENTKSSSETLYAKLSTFSNQIVKMKSDIAKQATDSRKMLETFGFKLQQNKDTCSQLSMLVSKLFETTIISYGLSLDQSFLNRDHEVYVTYNDGILVEITENKMLSYRRKQFIPELLKRAVMTEIVKLIDNTIINKPLIGWNRNEAKPSHLFPAICTSYMNLFEENIDNYGKKLISLDKKIDNKLANPNPNSKLMPKKEMFSKTIHHENQIISFGSISRYGEDSRQFSTVLFNLDNNARLFELVLSANDLNRQSSVVGVRILNSKNYKKLIWDDSLNFITNNFPSDYEIESLINYNEYVHIQFQWVPKRKSKFQCNPLHLPHKKKQLIIHTSSKHQRVPSSN